MDYIEYSNIEENSDVESLIKKNIQNKENIDNKLKKIYNYYIFQGYNNIISIQILNLFSTIFLVTLLGFLFNCVDYVGIYHIKNEEDDFKNYINFNNLLILNFFGYSLLIIFFLYILIRILTIFDDLYSYKKIKNFYRNKLKIRTKQLLLLKWNDIVDKIKLEYGNDYNIYNVNSIILKKENLFISLCNTKLLNFMVSKLMEWNLTYCVINNVYKYCSENNLEIRNNKIRIINRDKLKNIITNHFIILALLTYLFMPILFIYIFFFSFLKYGEKYYNNPKKFISKHYIVSKKWKLRYYNELRHEFDERMTISLKYVKDYLDSFKSKVSETIIKFFVFVSSSFFIVLIVLSIYNEHILLNLNISNGRPVLWYLGILGSLIAIGKSIVKDSIFEIDNKYDKLKNYNRLLDLNINCNNDELKKNNLNTYVSYQIIILFKESLSVLIVPYLLLYLCNYIDSILDECENELMFDEKLGLIVRNSNFRLLNENSNKKSLISFDEFRKKYPEWGANIQIYQIGENSLILDERNKKDDKINNYSILDATFDSEISII